jgi:hypothetical protein
MTLLHGLGAIRNTNTERRKKTAVSFNLVSFDYKSVGLHSSQTRAWFIINYFHERTDMLKHARGHAHKLFITVKIFWLSGILQSGTLERKSNFIGKEVTTLEIEA